MLLDLATSEPSSEKCNTSTLSTAQPAKVDIKTDCTSLHSLDDSRPPRPTQNPLYVHKARFRVVLLRACSVNESRRARLDGTSATVSHLQAHLLSVTRLNGPLRDNSDELYSLVRRAHYSACNYIYYGWSSLCSCFRCRNLDIKQSSLLRL